MAKLSIDSKRYAIRSGIGDILILRDKLARDSRLIKANHLPEFSWLALCSESDFDEACKIAWDKWDQP